jgi:hypothetical protein
VESVETTPRGLSQTTSDLLGKRILRFNAEVDGEVLKELGDVRRPQPRRVRNRRRWGGRSSRRKSSRILLAATLLDRPACVNVRKVACRLSEGARVRR